MSVELLFAAAGFAFVTSITPGPNNVILLASSLNFGFRRSMPFAFGVNLGFMVMLGVVGLGLGQVVRADPHIALVLKVLSLVYVLWLAWKIATGSAAPGAEDGRMRRPIGFVQGMFLQWINPKAWAVALIATVTYTDPGVYALSLGLMIVVFGVVNLPSVVTWAASGAVLRRFLRNPARLRIVNVTMAVLLLATMVPLFLDFASFTG